MKTIKYRCKTCRKMFDREKKYSPHYNHKMCDDCKRPYGKCEGIAVSTGEKCSCKALFNGYCCWHQSQAFQNEENNKVKIKEVLG